MSRLSPAERLARYGPTTDDRVRLGDTDLWVRVREDRQASFEALLEISGIDHRAVNCSTTDMASFRLSRAALVKDWLESEFEVVNTTYLSDLDY